MLSFYDMNFNIYIYIVLLRETLALSLLVCHKVHIMLQEALKLLLWIKEIMTYITIDFPRHNYVEIIEPPHLFSYHFIS